MPPDDVHIMMFYGRPMKVSLTHFIKFITITFLKYSFSVPPGNKTTEFIQSLINLGETFQGRPNCMTPAWWRPWDVLRTSILDKIQSTLLLYCFRSYSPNVLCEILKSRSLLILKVLEKRPSDILKTSWKDIRRMMSLGRP